MSGPQASTPIDRVLSCLPDAKKQGNGWIARCPAHADRKASLSISVNESGDVLVHCFAGCTFDQVATGMGLSQSDFFAGPLQPTGEATPTLADTPWKTVDIYYYHDATSEVLYRIKRIERIKDGERIKSFIQQRLDEDGDWTDGVTENGKWLVKRVLFNLPEVIKAIERGDTVFLVEGEKDAKSLAALGFVATTNAGGSKAPWLESYTQALAGAHVIVIPDNDSSGYEHAFEAVCSIHTVAASTKYLVLPDMAPKGDVTDYLATRKDEFASLITTATEWRPGDETLRRLADQAKKDSGKEQTKSRGKKPAANRKRNPASAAAALDCPFRRPLTDSGNGERLSDAHSPNLHYNMDSGQWLISSGIRFEEDRKEAIYGLALDVVRRGMADEIGELSNRLKDATSKEEQGAILDNIEQLGRHKLASESRARLEAMVVQARRCKGIAVRTADLDADPWLLNCLNGTIDLRTGTLRPHAREDLITKLAPVEYDPQAKCPRWHQFLREVFMDNAELIGFVKRTVGYCLTGSTREEAVFILVGKGGNGKSKFLDVLRAIMGDYAGDTPFTTFMEKRDTSTFDLAGLEGKRLVAASEGDEDQSFNESLLKQLSGGDPVTCCYKYRDYFTYVPKYKVLFSTNEVPRIASQNRAMKRRLKLIPFRQTFYQPHEGKQPVRDDGLLPKLLAEKSGILAWAVEGCLEWYQSGLNTPLSIQREIDRLFESQDPLGEWLDTQCEVWPGAQEEVGELWQAYCRWCDETGRKPAFKQTHRFSQNLAQRDGIDGKRGHGGVRMLSGICLKDSPVMVEDDDDADADDFPAECRVTHGDAKTDFQKTSFMKDSHGDFSAKSDYASPCVTTELENRQAVADAEGKCGPIYICSSCGGNVELHTYRADTYRYKCKSCEWAGLVTHFDYQQWLSRREVSR